LTTQQLVRRLRPNASPIEHAHNAHPTRYLHELLDVHMGHRLRLHRTRTEFRWPCSVSVLPRYHRSPILPRRNVHAIDLLHTKRSRNTHRTSLLCADSGDRFQRPHRSGSVPNGWCSRHCWLEMVVHTVRYPSSSSHLILTFVVVREQ
jgi:hypothetical protein